ncbi:hypothetical protein EQH57_0931 [Dictyocoela roeselum]|nr:hypothetical protein EQH57_0931 [Dictyocoela roeselum]
MKTKTLIQPQTEQIKKIDRSGMKKFVKNEKAEIFKGMGKEKAKIKLFIHEDSANFRGLNDREKMSEIIKLACVKCQEWYYRKGSSNKLPETWESFKEGLVCFLIDDDIDDIKKYREESYSKYITRMKHLLNDDIDADNMIIEKLKREFVPRDIRPLLYNHTITLSDIQLALEDYERIGSEINSIKQAKFPKKRGKIFKNTKTIKCYGCDEIGHIRPNCPYKNKNNEKENRFTNLAINDRELSENIQTSAITINSKKLIAIIDSGSSIDLICEKLLTKMKDLEIKQVNQPKKANLDK